MASLIISNNTSFGSMTNAVVGRAVSMQSSIQRLQEACATASSGYEGTPGTQFETPSGTINSLAQPNNFGVAADPDEPGKNGESYRYAVDQLKLEWDKFWSAAQPYLEALDNGTYA